MTQRLNLIGANDTNRYGQVAMVLMATSSMMAIDSEFADSSYIVVS